MWAGEIKTSHVLSHVVFANRLRVLSVYEREINFFRLPHAAIDIVHAIENAVQDNYGFRSTTRATEKEGILVSKFIRNHRKDSNSKNNNDGCNKLSRCYCRSNFPVRLLHSAMRVGHFSTDGAYFKPQYTSF